MNAAKDRRAPASDARGTARRWRESDGVHIDVRGLSPPTPLIAILELVASIRDATPVIVHHERDPQMLYPELAELGWTAERIDAPADEVRLKLTSAAAEQKPPERGGGAPT